MNKEKLRVNCPTCDSSVEWSEQNPFRPFCSKRCQLIDLGEWAKETHRIPTDEPLDLDNWDENSPILTDNQTY